MKIACSLLLLLSAALVSWALYVTFMVVPNEQVMGAVQRIFYFHVASAISCYLAFAIVLVVSVAFLATRQQIYDIINEAAAEVGFVFCTITLVTGMIWGHSAWNTWFRWEPRLVTFLLLWFVFLGFILQRFTAQPNLRGMHSAVIGIIGACMVPLVWVSVKFLPHSLQLHPVVIENRGLKDPLFSYGLSCAMFALITFQFFLVLFRTRIGILKAKLND